MIGDEGNTVGIGEEDTFSYEFFNGVWALRAMSVFGVINFSDFYQRALCLMSGSPCEIVLDE